MLIYSAATFDQTMKPSRGMLLLSFVLFLPVFALSPLDPKLRSRQQRQPDVSRHRQRHSSFVLL